MLILIVIVSRQVKFMFERATHLIESFFFVFFLFVIKTAEQNRSRKLWWKNNLMYLGGVTFRHSFGNAKITCFIYSIVVYLFFLATQHQKWTIPVQLALANIRLHSLSIPPICMHASSGKKRRNAFPVCLCNGGLQQRCSYIKNKLKSNFEIIIIIVMVAASECQSEMAKQQPKKMWIYFMRCCKCTCKWFWLFCLQINGEFCFFYSRIFLHSFFFFVRVNSHCGSFWFCERQTI